MRNRRVLTTVEGKRRKVKEGKNWNKEKRSEMHSNIAAANRDNDHEIRGCDVEMCVHV